MMMLVRDAPFQNICHMLFQHIDQVNKGHEEPHSYSERHNTTDAFVILPETYSSCSISGLTSCEHMPVAVFRQYRQLGNETE